MKKLSLLINILLGSFIAQAQIDCGTKSEKNPIVFTKAQLENIRTITAINEPLCVRIYITVFADDNGTNRANTDAEIMSQFQNMRNHYSPQSICFMLINLRQINSTDLNDQNADTEVDELIPYTVPGCINIFIHKNLPGLNGVSYGGILSMWSGAIGSTTNLTTLSHEVGHSLGLAHTFDTGAGRENVTRVTSNPCYNCETKGDLICDTPADDNIDPNSVDESCVYTGGRFDDCSPAESYAPMTNNIMAYGNRACRTTFTNGQGLRMNAMMRTNPTVMAYVNEDVVANPNSAGVFTPTFSSGETQQTARDLLTLSPYASNQYIVNGTAIHHIQSKKIVMKRGTKFSPAAGGKVTIKVNTYCNGL
ncbi:M43 family zinc metalloprotease [Emticicia sp. SJ17W-69]|uniref:M43 family zinc metalloprotease n=1 Tax=Emticicia sp. SJ17W-69 TaxID=3421657 RepID=UPI003EBE2431